MQQNKPELPEAENVEAYTTGQKIVLKTLKWGAWTASAVAMVYAMHY
ncbi:hypothetical protein [Sporomusa malonica]|uniref:Uncharacterized protein n=1 Tax=Sporomusa malonica TaxID=112901 RepID=A0A1W2C5R3_9FIRM|nr:hypothetical protein [Sporomusa malonica]SMC80549.1 hypothetical protein SAMN04488500_109164 [Sporomusa malonica]